MAKGQLLHTVALLQLMLFGFVDQAFAESRSNLHPVIKMNDGLYIFVSFSMPKNLLWELHQQAKKVGGKLLIRGLKNESFNETIAALKLEQDKILSVDINPKAFIRFNVNQVPTFVVLKDDSYDIACGNVSLSYVLTSFAENGSANIKSESKALLGKLLPHEQAQKTQN